MKISGRETYWMDFVWWDGGFKRYRRGSWQRLLTMVVSAHGRTTHYARYSDGWHVAAQY